MMRSYLPPRLWISVASRYDRGMPKGVGVVGVISVGVYGSGSPKGVRVVRGCRRRGVVVGVAEAWAFGATMALLEGRGHHDIQSHLPIPQVSLPKFGRQISRCKLHHCIKPAIGRWHGHNSCICRLH